MAGGQRFEGAGNNREHQDGNYTDLFTGFVGEGHRTLMSAIVYPDNVTLAVESLTVCNPDRKVITSHYSNPRLSTYPTITLSTDSVHPGPSA